MKTLLITTIAVLTAANVSAQAVSASAQLGALSGLEVPVPAAPAGEVSETLIPVPFEELSAETRSRLTSAEPRGPQEIIGMVGTLVSIGSAVIKVIKGGEIVYNNGYAAVYPKDADWRFFEWKKQVVYSFRYIRKLAGVTVVDSVIAVSFKYDGSYKGSGRYLGNIQVVGDKCYTMMSHKLTATAELPPSSVENLTPETPLNPLSAIGLNLTYAVSGLVNSGSRKEAYQLRGDGVIIDLATGEEPAGAAVRRFELK